MSQLTAEQLAQRIHDCGLLTNKELEANLRTARGQGEASFNDFMSTLLEQEMLTNWQIARVCEGHRRGYFYGDWKVLYLIGAGTFARVYRCVHQKTGDIKAVKVLRQRYATDMETREQFLMEAKMVMQLRHPNIVPISEVSEIRNRIYMVMDFVEGQNLRDYVKAHRKLPIDTALKITRDVLAGLKHAATFDITHRDLKLSNVLLSAKGVGKLVDFGLANVSKEGDDEKGGPRSIDYAGLERTTRVKRNDKRSDLYFVGCMLYNMLTGEPPLLETRERIKRLSASRFQDAKPITHFEPTLPHRVVLLVGKMMNLDASKRFQTPTAALQEIEATIKAIESGEDEQFDPEQTEQSARDYEKKLKEAEEGAGRTVLLIESNIKIQDSIRERLKALGYRVLITSDAQRGLERFEDLDEYDDRPADCVIFGCSGLGKQSVKAFAEFAQGEFTQKVPAIIIATKKYESIIKPEWLTQLRVKLLMPLSIKRLRKALITLLSSDGVPAAAIPEPAQEPVVVNEPAFDTELESDDD